MHFTYPWVQPVAKRGEALIKWHRQRPKTRIFRQPGEKVINETLSPRCYRGRKPTLLKNG
jgi:hypothetical protein